MESPNVAEEEMKKSVGEELYLVHLSRFNKVEPTPDDFDRDGEHHSHHKPDMSAGEELWRVHCKRNQGIEDEPDEEDDSSSSSSPRAKKQRASTTTTRMTPPKTKSGTRGRNRATRRVIHLRNRDVKIRQNDM